MRKLPIVLILCLALFACKKTPDSVIGEGEMAELLADIHEADAVVELDFENYPNDSVKKVLKQSIFIKHHVSQEQFDSSLMWYGQNLDIYKDVYGEVIPILESRQKSVQQEARKAGERLLAAGDSADVWQLPHNLLFDRRLTDGMVQLAFSMQSDGESKSGDRYKWNLRLPDAKNPVDLFLGVDYADGTSEYQTKSISPEMQGEIVLQADSTRAVERVYGYLHYRMQVENTIFISGISLIRMRLNAENYTMHPYQRRLSR